MNEIGKTTRLLKAVSFLIVLIFFLSPLIQLNRDIISPAQMGITGWQYKYPDTIMWLNLLQLVLGIIAYLLIIKLMLIRKKSIFKDIKAFIPQLFMLGFATLIILSTLKNGLTNYAMFGDKYVRENLLSFMLYTLVYFMFACFIADQGKKRILYLVIVITSLILSLLCLLDYYVEPFYFFYDNPDSSVHTVFHNSNHYGYFLTVAIIISANMFLTEAGSLLKWLCFINFLLNSAVLIINDTLGCYLAVIFVLIFELIVWIIRDRSKIKKALLLTGCFIVVSIVMSYLCNGIFYSLFALPTEVEKIAANAEDAGDAGTGRWGLWVFTVKLIKEKPLLGYGIEGVRDTIIEAGMQANPHNEYLEYAAFFGIPACLLYIASAAFIMIGVLGKLKKVNDTTVIAFMASLGYLASAFFGLTFYYTTPFIYCLLGLTYSELMLEKIRGGRKDNDRKQADQADAEESAANSIPADIENPKTENAVVRGNLNDQN